MSWIQMIVLSVVEGITEFLPISSTGHMILVSNIMGINEDEFVKNFLIIVQFGAILAILALYWRRFFVGLVFYRKLVLAFIPAGVIGILVKSKIDLILGEGKIVAYALIIGGFALIFLEKYFEKKPKGTLEVENLSDMGAFKIGLLQCFAFIPGVSRSAASIMAAMSQGFSRSKAAEFSFLLGIPTLGGATFLKVIKMRNTIEPEQIKMLLVGNIIAFFVALITVKIFLHFLNRKGFTVFGIYRIVVGIAFLYFVL